MSNNPARSVICGNFRDNPCAHLQNSSCPFKTGASGEMAEWLKAHAWKACVRETVPWVRIPLSPPVPRKSKKPLWQKDFLKMRKPKTIPANHTRNSQEGKRQLMALATLLGLMQAASKLSSELGALSDEVGGSLEKIAEIAGVPFFEVHNAYVKRASRGGAKPKKASKRA